jgi:hypothetical protein
MRSATTDGKTFSFDLINSLFKETNKQYEQVKNLLKLNKTNELVDFDDHFQDVCLDWRNSFIENYLN